MYPGLVSCPFYAISIYPFKFQKFFIYLLYFYAQEKKEEDHTRICVRVWCVRVIAFSASFAQTRLPSVPRVNAFAFACDRVRCLADMCSLPRANALASFCECVRYTLHLSGTVRKKYFEVSDARARFEPLTVSCDRKGGGAARVRKLIAVRPHGTGTRASRW